MNIRKAVIPAAGWGTRFLPATKAVPKAMLPLLDKPLIQYVIDEAVSSGIEQIIIVTYPYRSAIEVYFERSMELESTLEKKGESTLLKQIRNINCLADICYVRQKQQLGLGDAVLTARDNIGDEPFAVLLPDDIFDAEVPVTRQLIEIHQHHEGSVIGLWQTPRDEIKRYGIVRPQVITDRLHRILDMVEKPNPEDAPSNLAILGRYVLTPQIFDVLKITPPGKGGEIQLTDALAILLKQQPVYGYEFAGTYYDAGKPLSLLKASLALALKHPELGVSFRKYLKSLAKDL